MIGTFMILRISFYLDSNIFNNSLPKLTCAKNITREYDLKKSQLAFTIGKKLNENDKFPTILYLDTTIFSEDMMENHKDEPDADNETESSSTKSDASSHLCRMYRYAPRKGYTDEHEEVLIFYTGKIGVRTYGGS
jgi:hypothetical protein